MFKNALRNHSPTVFVSMTLPVRWIKNCCHSIWASRDLLPAHPQRTLCHSARWTLTRCHISKLADEMLILGKTTPRGNPISPSGAGCLDVEEQVLLFLLDGCLHMMLDPEAPARSTTSSWHIFEQLAFVLSSERRGMMIHPDFRGRALFLLCTLTRIS